MLLPSEIDDITDYINRHFVTLEDELVGEIAERISKVNEANVVALNQINVLNQMGLLNNEVYKKVAQATNKTEQDIKQIVSGAMITSFKRDNIIFSNEVLKDNLKISESLMQTLKADISRLNYDLNNLTGTTAMTTQTAFLNAINQAHLEVITGAKSYTSAMIDAIDKVSASGIDVLYHSGHKDRVEVATRRAIVTSVNQTNGELQLRRMQDLGWDLVEVSAHIGARPTHAIWQGQVYSLSGKSGYKNFYEETEYGTMLGLCGINCRHTFFPFYKGSTYTYNTKELEEINNKKVNFNGKEITYYQATQYQRYLERTIRKYTRQIEGNSKLLLNNSDIDVDQVKYSIKTIKAKKNGVQNILNELESQVGLKSSNRLYTVGSEVKLLKNPSAKNTIYTNVKKNAIMETTRNYTNNFSQKVGKEFYDNLKDIIDKSTDNNLKKAWDKFEDKLDVITTTLNGTAYHRRGSLYLNILRDKTGNIFEKPYSVTTHETGHAIDYLSSQQITNTRVYANFFSARYKNGIFPQTITDEVNQLISNREKELKELFKINAESKNYKWFIDKGFISQYGYDMYKNDEELLKSMIKYKKAFTYKDIQNEFLKQYNRYEYSDISDIFGGATNNRLSMGIGHESGYWKDREINGVNVGLSTEAFAEMTSATLTQNESLNVIKKYLPKSYELYKEIVSEILK